MDSPKGTRDGHRTTKESSTESGDSTSVIEAESIIWDERLRSILIKLRQINQADSAYIARLALLDLYKLYVAQCARRAINLENAMTSKAFFIYLAMLLGEKDLTLLNVTETQMKRLLGELSSPIVTMDNNIDEVADIKESVARVVAEIYYHLCYEEELFGFSIVNNIRIKKLKDNPHCLTFCADLRDTIDQECLISGKELFRALSQVVYDNRTFDLLKFYEIIGPCMRSRAASSPGSSSHTSPLSTSSSATGIIN